MRAGGAVSAHVKCSPDRRVVTLSGADTVGVVGTDGKYTAAIGVASSHRAAADAPEARQELRTRATDFCCPKAAAMRDVGAAGEGLRAPWTATGASTV
jgi:hypothetical protein